MTLVGHVDDLLSNVFKFLNFDIFCNSETNEVTHFKFSRQIDFWKYYNSLGVEISR